MEQRPEDVAGGGDRAYVIRPLRSPEDYRASLALQEDTWGAGFSERVPPAILKVSRILGGVASGAFSPAGRLVGFVFGMTGALGGELVHWSDMLAVRPEARDAGLGTRLKLHQREEVMARGIRTMYWTFDPLQARNAHLNLNRLGAVVRDYAADLYPESNSPLHREIGTDRLVATWELEAPGVLARIDAGLDVTEMGDPTVRQGTTGARSTISLLEATSVDGLPAPEPVTSERLEAVTEADDHATLSVAIPTDLGAIVESSVALAREWRRATRRALRACLTAGLEVTGFLRGEVTGSYLLIRGDTTSRLAGRL